MLPARRKVAAAALLEAMRRFSFLALHRLGRLRRRYFATRTEAVMTLLPLRSALLTVARSSRPS